MAKVTPEGQAQADDGDSQVWISPGFIDLQVNGFAGHDVNAERPTVDDIEQMIRALWPTGVALVLPTVVTGSYDRLERAMRTLAAAKRSTAVGASILGIHLEGPYISPEDGPRGAHPKEHVRSPDWEEFCRLQDAAEGLIRLVTLAPELSGAISFIEKAVESGTVVAIGHTAATPADITAAVHAGASLSTHLGNGAHALMRRHPNYIWEQLAADELYASLIPDGFHLPSSVMKAFIRAKGTDRTILVSDAVGVAGLPPGAYDVLGTEIELTPRGKVILSGTDFLAGSALRLSDGISNVFMSVGTSLAEALKMVTINPAKLLRVDDRIGAIRTGMEANLTLFRLNGGNGIVVAETIVAGESVFTGR